MTKVNLENLGTRDLLDIYNVTAVSVGESSVNRFADKKSALRRTKAIVLLAEEMEAKTETPEVPTTKTDRKKREMYFMFKPDVGGIKPISGKDTQRSRAIKLLTTGATFEQVQELVKEYDVHRGFGDPKTLKFRTYQLIRILHYYLGYGIRKDEKGIISIYTN